MIQRITDTSGMDDVYFDDIDEPVSSRPDAYVVNSWYFYHYSTLEAAQEKARSTGQSEEVVG